MMKIEVTEAQVQYAKFCYKSLLTEMKIVFCFNRLYCNEIEQNNEKNVYA